MYCVCMHSVQACKLAMDQGWAINIGGGFGHHTANTGGGLAVYDDVLLCLSVSMNKHLSISECSIHFILFFIC